MTSISWKNDDNHHRGSGEIVIRTKGNSTTTIYLPSRPHVTTSKKEQMSSEKISLWKEPILCESQSRQNLSFCCSVASKHVVRQNAAFLHTYVVLSRHKSTHFSFVGTYKDSNLVLITDKIQLRTAKNQP